MSSGGVTAQPDHSFSYDESSKNAAPVLGGPCCGPAPSDSTSAFTYDASPGVVWKCAAIQSGSGSSPTGCGQTRVTTLGHIYDLYRPLIAPNSLLDDLRACRSFSADTVALMADSSTKPISEVGAGDWVLAESPEPGERGPREVVRSLPHVDEFVVLETSVGSVVTTEDHLYWNCTEAAWQESQGLGVCLIRSSLARQFHSSRLTPGGSVKKRPFLSGLRNSWQIDG